MGKVVDAVSRQPLELVTVTTSAGNKTVTDINGKFYLKADKKVSDISLMALYRKTSSM